MSNFTYDCQCEQHDGNPIDLDDDLFPNAEFTKLYSLNPEWCWSCNRKARVAVMEQTDD